MKKKICFVLAAIMTVVNLGVVVISEKEDQITQIILLLIAIPLTISIFTYAQHTIDKAPERRHGFAAFFRINVGSSSIFYGLPALVYIIYTWVRRNDGYVMRGKEYEGAQGAAIILLTLLSMANTLIGLPEWMADALPACCFIVAVVAAWYAERQRTIPGFK